MKIHMRLMAAIATLGILAGCGERPPIETKQIGYRGTGMEQNINPRRQEMLKAMNQIGGIQPPADASGPLAKDLYQNVQVLSDLSVGEFTRRCAVDRRRVHALRLVRQRARYAGCRATLCGHVTCGNRSGIAS